MNRVENCKRLFTTHGFTKNGKRLSEYRSWEAMIRRCHSANSDHKKYYFDRGIIVCERWRTSFAAFLEDMGPKPSPAHSLERINNNGNYEPGNCEWALHKQQMRNTRKTIKVTFEGQEVDLHSLAEKFSIQPATLKWRLRNGWPIERAIIPPTEDGRTLRRFMS